jgi:hypothetical protein
MKREPPTKAAPRRLPEQAPTPAPNALRKGAVTRTLWPPAAGTKRWQQLYGDALLCVRHRQDAAGLRRVVTVELVVGAVAHRRGQPGLQDRAQYPVKLAMDERELKAALKVRKAWWDPESGCWYAHGRTIRELRLEDRILMRAPARR